MQVALLTKWVQCAGDSGGREARMFAQRLTPGTVAGPRQTGVGGGTVSPPQVYGWYSNSDRQRSCLT